MRGFCHEVGEGGSPDLVPRKEDNVVLFRLSMIATRVTEQVLTPRGLPLLHVTEDGKMAREVGP